MLDGLLNSLPPVENADTSPPALAYGLTMAMLLTFFCSTSNVRGLRVNWGNSRSLESDPPPALSDGFVTVIRRSSPFPCDLLFNPNSSASLCKNLRSMLVKSLGNTTSFTVSSRSFINIRVKRIRMSSATVCSETGVNGLPPPPRPPFPPRPPPWWAILVSAALTFRAAAHLVL